jgi:hypothetical protein
MEGSSGRKQRKVTEGSSASSSAQGSRHVFVLVPFAEKARGKFEAPDFHDPHQSAQEWVDAKNADKSRGNKVYQKISMDGLKDVDFSQGHRLYVHGHGGSRKEHQNKLYDSGDAHITPTGLRDGMKHENPDIFKTGSLDVRIASCYSAQSKFAETLASSLSSERTATGSVKGYSGQLNVMEMTTRARVRATKPTEGLHKLAGLGMQGKKLVSASDKSREVHYDRDKAEFKASVHATSFPVVPPAAPRAKQQTGETTKKRTRGNG